MTTEHEKYEALTRAAVEYIQRYPQYRSDALHTIRGVMTRTFYKNGHHYARKGDQVLYVPPGTREWTRVFCLDSKGDPHWLSVPNSWVEEWT